MNLLNECDIWLYDSSYIMCDKTNMMLSSVQETLRILSMRCFFMG